MTDLIILFFSSLLAATIFPAQSEIILASIHLSGKYELYVLLLIATFGNVLGSVFNWFLGYYFVKFQHKKWFPISANAIKKHSQTYQKWGIWALLLAWVPIIGDPLTVIAGIFRTNIWKFLLLVTIGKAARYFFILSVISIP